MLQYAVSPELRVLDYKIVARCTFFISASGQCQPLLAVLSTLVHGINLTFESSRENLKQSDLYPDQEVDQCDETLLRADESSDED